MTGRDKFSEIQTQVIDSTHKVSTYKAQEAYQNSQKALGDFKKLHHKVQEVSQVDDLVILISTTVTLEVLKDRPSIPLLTDTP